MRAVSVRSLAVLATTLGLAAFVNPPASSSVAEASARLSSSTLSVGMYCEYGHCEATASGGSGNYTWSWNNAVPNNTTGSISTATPCYVYNNQYVTVTATVSDGSSTASASRRYRCSY
ncbi:MAG TPA: hypothetical protein VLK84_25130 [Longimicrobium sp.]|nr:hypothetical protein [Longimicrobium sp.]